MPYSFTQIEEDKTKTIGFIFAFLVFFYFLAAWVIYFASKIYLLSESTEYGYRLAPFSVGFTETLVVLVVACVVGVLHWSLAVNNLIPRICRILNARPLDLKDTYHSMFQNILEEVSVATGGKKIEGVVIPTMATNAFALADLKGGAVVGVTEGLLARLTRAQVEAVVGHEAAHIMTGDCIATTISSSLFKLYGAALSRMNFITSRNNRGSSRGSGYIALIYMLIWLINFAGTLLNMFISRQREFRADAIAVRLTRDPLSLAEALYTISSRWRGGGISGEDIEAIFIVNPKFTMLDEAEGFFSDWFSTHPPVHKRLEVLLGMAHANVAMLEDELVKKQNKPRPIMDRAGIFTKENEKVSAKENEWVVYKDGQWLGPFDFSALSGLDWVKPDTWLKRIGGERVLRAYEDGQVAGLFKKGQTTQTQAVSSTEILCPHCRVAFNEVLYEGTPVLECLHCHGLLMNAGDALKIIVREDVGFSQKIIAMAERLKKEDEEFGTRRIDLKAASWLPCPKCRQGEIKMVRAFYTEAYRVEVDKCMYCGSVWFDRDELEILQYLIESNAQGK